MPVETPPLQKQQSMISNMIRGAAGRCPCCGTEDRVFTSFIKVVEECTTCSASLGQLCADDAPPYFTIFISGHIIVPLILLIERISAPPLWLHMLIWIPITLSVTLLLMRPIKGATLGLLWSLKDKSLENDD